MNIKNFSEDIEKMQKSYKRGLLTDTDVKTWIENTIIDAFKEFYGQGRFERHIDQDSFKRFTEDHQMWKDQDEPCSMTGTPWLIDREKDGEADHEKKKEFFDLIDMFHIPINYFEPIPADVICPDSLPGHYPGETIIGWKIWEDDGGLLSDGFMLGDVIKLTDRKGLKSVLRIIKDNRPEDKSIQNVEYDYLAMGTIEGYTSSREREVKVYVRDGKIDHLTTFIMGNDDAEAFLNNPLWKDYNIHMETKEKIRQEVVEKILSFVKSGEKYN